MKQKIEVTKDFLLEIIKYINDLETTIDDEFGMCRSIEEIISEEEMPEIYTKLKALVDGK